jgi:hypothetical protein
MTFERTKAIAEICERNLLQASAHLPLISDIGSEMNREMRFNAFLEQHRALLDRFKLGRFIDNIIPGQN